MKYNLSEILYWKSTNCAFQRVELAVKLHVLCIPCVSLVILINGARGRAELSSYSLYRKYYKAVITGRGEACTAKIAGNGYCRGAQVVN